MDLTTNERKVLEALRDDAREVESVAEESGVGRGPAEQAAYLLQEKGLAEVEEEVSERFVLTEEGRRYAEQGLPERRLHDYLVEEGGASIEELRGVEGFDVGMGHLRRKEWASIEDGEAEPLEAPVGEDEEALEALLSGDAIEEDVGEGLRDRNLVERETEREVRVELTEEGRQAVEEGVEAEGIGEITPELLSTGEWRGREFSPYNVEADAEPRYGGREHILRQLANRVKEVLTSMGFEEMVGPHVDAEFWINDCLFMPQDHPARTHWDAFYVEEPSHIDELPDALASEVERMHREGARDGEGYHSPWSRDVARRLNLRGHTTSLSMRYLSRDLEPPERYFSVDKVYRNDTLDPTHLLEFYQIEGWVMAEGLSVRDLMGTFVEFYRRFGITDLRFKPHYNPYTEPSFEIFGEHPETGELIEIGNSGMFRREVLEPHGVDDGVDVIAWGLALERLLMLIYGFEDIRDVHGTLCDLELLREVPVLWR